MQFEHYSALMQHGQESYMIYTVLKNNEGEFNWEGEFNSLRETRAYCKAMTRGKQKVNAPFVPRCNTFCFEIYRGEVEVSGEEAYPREGTGWYDV